MRQCPDHYAIRAGRNLPDKEFRYLRTVIVTAAVYRGFNSEREPFLLTFRHRAGVTPYTSSFDLAESCVFDKQSPGPIHCGSHCEHPLSRSYGVNLPSSLTTLLPLALGFSPHLPVSVCGTGTLSSPFLATEHLRLPYYSSVPYARGNQRPGSDISMCQLLIGKVATEFQPYVHRLRLSASP